MKDPKHRALLVLLYSAGLRLGEALRLRVQDVDEEGRVIHVRSGKGKKDRIVMLARVAAEELEAYQRFEGPTYWLFPGAGRRDLVGIQSPADQTFGGGELRRGEGGQREAGEEDDKGCSGGDAEGT